MRRGKPHHEAAAACGDTLKGRRTSWEEPIAPFQPGDGLDVGRLLGVRRTLKESVSPWEDAEAVETQPGIRAERRP
jgi:hypothetical protein